MYCSQPMGQTVDYIWNSGGLTWFCPGSAGLMIIGAEKELIIMRRTWKWELNNNGLHCSSGAKMSLSYDLHPFKLSFGIFAIFSTFSLGVSFKLREHWALCWDLQGHWNWSKCLERVLSIYFPGFSSYLYHSGWAPIECGGEISHRFSFGGVPLFTSFH